VTATRIFEGQQKGMHGEENSLSFEKFPHVAVTKTYNDNAQTPDSAGTATAIFSGVKTKQGVIGIAKEALRGSCADALNNPVTTIMELAENIGLATGIVTTAKVTHATPAATYAHSAERAWEDIAPRDCKDIASQLVEFPIGDGIDLVMGGGRQHFLSRDQNDHEDLDKTGNRRDGRDLTKEWSGTYIWNKEQFDQLDSNSGRILGLFNRDHMEYEYERIREHNSVTSADEPSLPEMTAKAIELLSKNPNGYFLMVEAGRVDHAAHAGNAYQMLNENLLFSQAVQKAIDSVNLEETLIIVTADHAHTVTLSGYAQRGNNILGLVKGVDGSGRPENSPSLARDFQPYTSLNFATGPGASRDRNGLTEDQVTSPDYVQSALIPFPSGTHSSEDVITYATGPMAHLVGGVIEQNYIFHVINQALKLGEKRVP